MTGEDRFLAIAAFFTLLGVAFTVFEIARKLDRIIRLLEIGNELDRDPHI